MADQNQEQETVNLEDNKKTKKPRKVGVNKTGELSAWWVKFFEKIRGFESVEASKWTDHEILGYLCSKYEALYGHSLSFSLKGSPSRCDEMFTIKKIKFVLNSDNPKLVKEYIDWVFKTKLEPKSVKLVSLKYFMTPGICNEFKHYFYKKSKISRTTQLPSDILQVLKDQGKEEIATYGDLAFIKMAVDDNPESEDLVSYKELLNLLERYCFDLSKLNTLED